MLRNLYSNLVGDLFIFFIGGRSRILCIELDLPKYCCSLTTFGNQVSIILCEKGERCVEIGSFQTVRHDLF